MEAYDGSTSAQLVTFMTGIRVEPISNLGQDIYLH
jgi:hypothetical protein